jgi:hypothetical protein
VADVEILYFAGCPAYRRARERAIDAMRAAGLPGNPAMLRVRHARDAAALDFHGSPTLRVRGRDIDPAGLADFPEVGLFSRTYRWKGKSYDAPPAEMVAAALEQRPRRPP